MNVYSRRIKEYMENSKLTMEDIAERSGLSINRIESIILKDRVPDISELLAIAEIHEISMDYFLGRIKYPLCVSRTKWQAEFNYFIEQLSAEELYGLLKKTKELGILDE